MTFQQDEDRFVDKMIELRKQKGYSQNEFAKKLQSVGLQWKQPTVARVEERQRPLRFVEVLAIASFFNRTVESMSSAPHVTRHQVVTRLAAEALLAEQLYHHHDETDELAQSVEATYNTPPEDALPAQAKNWLEWLKSAPAGQQVAFNLYSADNDLYESASAEVLRIPSGSIQAIPHNSTGHGTR